MSTSALAFALVIASFSFEVSAAPAPSLQQGPKLVGSGAVSQSAQGKCVAISADGNTAVVGGYNDAMGRGAAWVYSRSGGLWSQQGPKLVGSGATESPIERGYQGYSVGIAGDGNTIIVGGIGDSTATGAAWVFTRSNGVWSQQGAKLVGSGATAGASQGTSVALSADGNTALVGGSFDNTDVGAAWVFTRNGGVWSQQGSKLAGNDAVGASFQGASVSLSADGNTAIVGGPYDEPSWEGTSMGAAWVFVRSAGVWTQQGAKLVGTGSSSAYQGSSVAMSADGNTAVVSGHDDALGGLTWVYTRSGGVWSQQGSPWGGGAYQGTSIALSADASTVIAGRPSDNGTVGGVGVFTYGAGVWSPQGANLAGTGAIGMAQQGTGVALSADGNTAIVGGPGDDRSVGASWVFTRSVGVWSQQGSKLAGTDATHAAAQGHSVSLSADGNTAIEGGNADDSDVGATWVFWRSGSGWSQQGAKLVGTGASGGTQGSSVSLSGDGNTAIIGGPYSDGVGAAWIFARSGGVWSQQGSNLVGTGATGFAGQGSSVALSGDGNTAIVGGPFDADSHTEDGGSAGAVWVFTRSGIVWSQQGTKLLGSDATVDASQGSSVALSSDGNTALVGGAFDNSQTGAAWVYTRSGGVWSQQGAKLVGTGGGGAKQGSSVALSGDGNTAVVGGPNDVGGIGAAWVYTRSGGVWSQQGTKLVGSGAIGASLQGQSVAISADGNTIVVGGSGDNAGLGATWVYTRSGGAWNQHGAKLVGSGAIRAAQQGFSVALSGNGGTAMVGGAHDDGGTGATWVFIDPAIVSVTRARAPSSTLELAPLVPNPTTGPLAITFSVPKDAEVRLEVFDIAGRSVKSLVAGTTVAGRHTIRWDGRTSAGRAAPDGIYLLSLRSGGTQLTRRLVLIR
jgi:FlgD Ig-like domain